MDLAEVTGSCLGLNLGLKSLLDLCSMCLFSAAPTVSFYSDRVSLHLSPLPTSWPNIGALLPSSQSTMVVS